MSRKEADCYLVLIDKDTPEKKFLKKIKETMQEIMNSFIIF
jgi:hypothetical protein